VGAVYAGVKATASLAVIAGPLAKLSLNPTNSTIGLADSQIYTATGQDQFGNPIGDVTANTTFTIAPDGSCTGASCKGTAIGTHTVTGADGLATGTATLVIAAAVDHITISPSSSTISAGSSQTYQILGYDAGNKLIGDVTSTTVLTISPDGSCRGATCTATIAGPHTVTASRSGKTATATLTVTPGPAVKLGLTPSSSSIPQGGTQGYFVQGLDQYGNQTGDLTSSSMLWIAPDGKCSGRLCPASVVGPHTVTATSATLTGQASLEVVPVAPAITSPSEGALTPPSVTVSGTAGPGQGIKIYDGFALIADGVLADASGNWAAPLSFPDGDQHLTAKAYAGSDLSAASSIRTFTVDAQAPTLTIFAPFGSTSFLSAYLPGNPTLRGTATDNHGVASIKLTYKDLLSGTVVKTVTARCAGCPGASVAFTDQLPPQPGLFEVTGISTDLVGNKSKPVVQTFFSFGF